MPSEVISKTSETHMKFLPYDLSYITDDLRKRAKEELFEDEDTRYNSLKLIRSLLKGERNLHSMDTDDFLLSFLRARKFDVKRSFNLLKTYYHVRQKHNELYDNFNYEDCKFIYKDNVVGFLPYRDEEGCVILVIKIENWNPYKASMGECMRAVTTGLLHSILSPATQVAGIKAIIDFKGLSYSQLAHLSPTYLWLFTEAAQNSFPARFKAVHIVNEGTAFKYVWSVIKPFLTKKLKERIQCHGKNVDRLHKYISPSILPKEYKGDLPTFNTTEWSKTVEKAKDHLTHIYSYGYINSKTASS